MSDTEINVEEILKSLREMIGQQAQEIAILKATISKITKDNKVE